MPITEHRKLLSLPKKLAFVGIVFAVCAVIAYSGALLLRSRSLYEYAKLNSRGWSGSVHGPDSVLGFAPIPDTRGSEIFPVGPEIPMRYDSEGFRVPIDDAQRAVAKSPLVLALGCSFTYGAACLAEEAYPYKTASLMGGASINAGGCSYGLAQMLLRARTLIEKKRPQYVLVQYSPWLVDRSVSVFAPVYFSHLPAPYFTDGKDGSVKLAPPVFETHLFDVNLNRYRNTTPSFGERVRFCAFDSFPLFLRDDLSILSYKLKNGLGFIPVPTLRRESVIARVYGDILRVCQANGAQMIVVVIGQDPRPVEIPSAIAKLQIPIANAHAQLVEKLSHGTADEYYTAYTHYRGDPPRQVDNHPNAKAHGIIAETIFSTINQTNSK